MGNSSLPVNAYSLHFFFGFLASAGSEYLTTVPLTVLVSAAKAPESSRLTPSFSALFSPSTASLFFDSLLPPTVFLSEIRDLGLEELALVLDLDPELLRLRDPDRDLELSEDEDDLDRDLENFPRRLLFLFVPLFRDRLLEDLSPLDLDRLRLDLDLLLPLLRSRLVFQCLPNLFTFFLSSWEASNLSCCHFSLSSLTSLSLMSTATSSLLILPVTFLCSSSPSSPLSLSY